MTITSQDLPAILEKHRKWLRSEDGGQRADLRCANLQCADLQGADLRGAYLQCANLQCADLQGADLRGAYLQCAYLQGANLRGAKNADLAIAMTRILPAGSLIGWKKCAEGRVVKLRIPEEAKRLHAFGRKCRAEFAEALAIYGEAGAACKSATSSHNSAFVYRIGETVRPTRPFNEDFREECSAGIHFFITREEAEAYEP